MPLIATTKGPSWLALAFGVVGGVMMVVMAIYFIILVRFLSPLSVYVCRDGFFTVYREKPGVCRIDVFRWDQIDWVQETVKQEYFPLKGVAKYAAPMGKYRSCLVHRKDGLEFVFDGDTVKKVGKLARLVQKQINERGIPWHVVA